MKAGTIKGALLEYIVRNLLTASGFTNVKADKIYTYESHGLFYINGRGAAHDADIIMNPPIQMPFSYPYQLLFECKAHKATTSLTIVRNALGLRNDLNEFEIVTLESLKKRKNNKRASYAVEMRNRFLYQVGVASIGAFTKPTIEFAANNKIPLLSLSWFLGPKIVNDFAKITQEYLNGVNPTIAGSLYRYFKDRTRSHYTDAYRHSQIILEGENPISRITKLANEAISYSYIGLLETGDMVFLFAEQPDHILAEQTRPGDLEAEIHWREEAHDVWELTVFSKRDFAYRSRYKFFVPERILNHWEKFNFNKSAALDIKQEFFGRMFVFNQHFNNDLPFSIINIDEYWLREARLRNNDTRR